MLGGSWGEHSLKVARRARAGQTFPQRPSHVVYRTSLPCTNAWVPARCMLHKGASNLKPRPKLKPKDGVARAVRVVRTVHQGVGSRVPP